MLSKPFITCLALALLCFELLLYAICGSITMLLLVHVAIVGIVLTLIMVWHKVKTSKSTTGNNKSTPTSQAGKKSGGSTGKTGKSGGSIFGSTGKSGGSIFGSTGKSGGLFGKSRKKSSGTSGVSTSPGGKAIGSKRGIFARKPAANSAGSNGGSGTRKRGVLSTFGAKKQSSTPTRSDDRQPTGKRRTTRRMLGTDQAPSSSGRTLGIFGKRRSGKSPTSKGSGDTKSATKQNDGGKGARTDRDSKSTKSGKSSKHGKHNKRDRKSGDDSLDKSSKKEKSQPTSEDSASRRQSWADKAYDDFMSGVRDGLEHDRMKYSETDTDKIDNEADSHISEDDMQFRDGISLQGFGRALIFISQVIEPFAPALNGLYEREQQVKKETREVYDTFERVMGKISNMAEYAENNLPINAAIVTELESLVVKMKRVLDDQTLSATTIGQLVAEADAIAAMYRRKHAADDERATGENGFTAAQNAASDVRAAQQDI
jgi:hypothetical protein